MRRRCAQCAVIFVCVVVTPFACQTLQRGTAWVQPETNDSAAPDRSTTRPEPDPLEQLAANGTKFRRAPVNSTVTKKGLTCAIEDAVVVTRGATGIRYNRTPHVSARFAVRLAAFENLVQEVAAVWFDRPVVKIEQLGTYVCRHVAGGERVSEHALGNAIDVSAFVLKGGKRIVVRKDYVLESETPLSPAANFLRQLVLRLRQEETFGVILTPDWDSRHNDHLHLDGSARWSWRRWLMTQGRLGASDDWQPES